MRRVAIVGSGGAGKSTLARRMGEITGLPVVDLDRLYWRPGWTPTPKPEWRETVQRLVEEDLWIIDGNYMSTMGIRIPAADTILFMDYSRIRCMWRTTRRVLTYRRHVRPDMGEDCPEKINVSCYKWMWNFRKDIRPKIMALIEANRNGKEVYILRNPKDADRLLAELQRKPGRLFQQA
ncbi:MAG: hypothetical protein FJ319_06805 [SAR202 cluster bacterium]|nr:hypothetical protein [SAR202 cluster bacterium]